MKLIRKTTWRDDGEEILGEERATLLASNCVARPTAETNGYYYARCYWKTGVLSCRRSTFAFLLVD
jgi:hypothetical protein